MSISLLVEPDTAIRIRHAEPSDYQPVIAVVNDWWGGRSMSDMLPKLFFIHFHETSFVAERDGEMVGFLNGFFSQTYLDTAYIHFVGIHPAVRKLGVGHRLYEHFFDASLKYGRSLVRCVTSLGNKTSIAFHKRLGFTIEPGNTEVDGVQVNRDYDGPGEERVLFVKEL
jgi:predicted GNAT superfamily acetyltransferase